MKSFSVFLILLFFTAILGYAQIGNLIYTDQIEFETSHPWVRLDTNISGNIWRTGIPSKTFMDSAYSPVRAMITDTVNTYPVNNCSYFDIVIDDGLPAWYIWGEGILGFMHKYDTDSLFDGGYIEVSYDGGLTWENIINDMHALDISASGYYDNTDTISGGTPAFSGHSDGWVYSEFYWWWNALTKDFPMDSLIVRFNFKSDGVQNNKEGWMIDHISFYAFAVVGGNESIKKNEKLKVYYSSTQTAWVFILPESENQIAELIIYDSIGRCVYRSGNFNERLMVFNISDYQGGYYFYKLTENENVFCGKIIVP